MSPSASSAKQRKRSVDSSITAATSNTELLDAAGDSSYMIHVLLDDNVDSKALMRTSRMDDRLIASTPRIASASKYTTDK